MISCIWTDSPLFGNYMNSLVKWYVFEIPRLWLKHYYSMYILQISAACQTITHPGLDKFRNWEKIIRKVFRILAWLLHASTLSIGLTQKTLNIQRVLSDLCNLNVQQAMYLPCAVGSIVMFDILRLACQW